MAALTVPFTKAHRGIGYPIVSTRLSLNGKQTRKYSALVDTGAIYTLMNWTIATRELKISDDEIKKQPSVKLGGIGGVQRGYKIVVEQLLLEHRGATLTLANTTVYVVKNNLPQPILLGQRCALERLWLFHQNDKERRYPFLLGERKSEIR